MTNSERSMDMMRVKTTTSGKKNDNKREKPINNSVHITGVRKKQRERERETHIVRERESKERKRERERLRD